MLTGSAAGCFLRRVVAVRDPDVRWVLLNITKQAE
jgi:hypothetical protein